MGGGDSGTTASRQVAFRKCKNQRSGQQNIGAISSAEGPPVTHRWRSYSSSPRKPLRGFCEYLEMRDGSGCGRNDLSVSAHASYTQKQRAYLKHSSASAQSAWKAGVEPRPGHRSWASWRSVFCFRTGLLRISAAIRSTTQTAAPPAAAQTSARAHWLRSSRALRTLGGEIVIERLRFLAVPYLQHVPLSSFGIHKRNLLKAGW